jgi:hypothetical protein
VRERVGNFLRKTPVLCETHRSVADRLFLISRRQAMEAFKTSLALSLQWPESTSTRFDQPCAVIARLT